MERGLLIERLSVEEAEVYRRINRFAVRCITGRGERLLHLRNTGRLPDLIYAGARVLYLPKKGGKTHGLIIGAMIDGDSAALIDPVTQTRVFEKSAGLGLLPWFRGREIARREVPFLGRRIDYLIRSRGSDGLLEVKSAVFHSGDGYCMYPDTVSLRGRRHVEALIKAREAGLDVLIVFISAHPLCRAFKPCRAVDPEVARLLSEARRRGVEIYSIKMHMRRDGEVLLDDASLPVELEP